MGFLQHEKGAVTVDWVVLTAGLVGLGLAAISVVSIGVQDTGNDIKSSMLDQDFNYASWADISYSLLSTGFDAASDIPVSQQGKTVVRSWVYDGWSHNGPTDLFYVHNATDYSITGAQGRMMGLYTYDMNTNPHTRISLSMERQISDIQTGESKSVQISAAEHRNDGGELVGEISSSETSSRSKILPSI